jgi:hypothetical protein
MAEIQRPGALYQQVAAAIRDAIAERDSLGHGLAY